MTSASSRMTTSALFKDLPGFALDADGSQLDGLVRVAAFCVRLWKNGCGFCAKHSQSSSVFRVLRLVISDHTYYYSAMTELISLWHSCVSRHVDCETVGRLLGRALRKQELKVGSIEKHDLELSCQFPKTFCIWESVFSWNAINGGGVSSGSPKHVILIEFVSTRTAGENKSSEWHSRRVQGNSGPLNTRSVNEGAQ